VGSGQGVHEELRVYMQWLTTVHTRFGMQDGQTSTLKAEAGMKEERSENIAGNMMES
jgi:hypothetical protein